MLQGKRLSQMGDPVGLWPESRGALSLPTAADMWRVCTRLASDLSSAPPDRAHLREAEMVLRLALVHVLRGLAEAVHRLGPRTELQHASQHIRAAQDTIAWLAEHRETAELELLRTRLLEATHTTCQVLQLLDTLRD